MAYHVAEGNLLTALLVFIAAIVLDALCAIPTSVVIDVPSSLRTTALILTTIAASPAIVTDLLIRQRVVAFGMLLAVAIAGLHEGRLNSRIADALYSLLGSWATTFFFAVPFGAANVAHTDADAVAKQRREALTSLAATTLGYSGARIARQGIFHAEGVTSFAATHEGVHTPGFGFVDDVAASLLVFGGTVCVGAAVAMLSAHEAVYHKGSACLTNLTAQLAIVVFATALLVQLVAFSRVVHLSATFGSTACNGSPDACETAYRTRRLFVANASPAALWACAVGLTCLSFPHRRRCRSRKSTFRRECADAASPHEREYRNTAHSTGWIACIACLVVLGAILELAPSPSGMPGLELGLLFLSIPLALFGNGALACAVHAGGLCAYTAGRVGSVYGFELTFLTHWILLATLVLSIALAATTAMSWVLYNSGMVYEPCSYSEPLEFASALMLVVLLSSQLFLVLAALSLGAAYDGSPLEVGWDWQNLNIGSCIQHNLSFFFASSLLASRFEPFNGYIEPETLRCAFFGGPLALMACWAFTVFFFNQASVPYTSFGDPLSLSVAILAALAPWASAGIAAC
jgi:hypothetical protein